MIKTTVIWQGMGNRQWAYTHEEDRVRKEKKRVKRMKGNEEEKQR